jgi:hypothetical protein
MQPVYFGFSTIGILTFLLIETIDWRFWVQTDCLAAWLWFSQQHHLMKRIWWYRSWKTQALTWNFFLCCIFAWQINLLWRSGIFMLFVILAMLFVISSFEIWVELWESWFHRRWSGFFGSVGSCIMVQLDFGIFHVVIS